eukprot:6457143-Amphidinium_carterae.1
MHPTAPMHPSFQPPTRVPLYPVPPPNPMFTRAVLYLDIDTRVLCPLAPSKPQRPRPHHWSPTQRLNHHI